LCLVQVYGPMGRLQMRDLRRLIHPQLSRVQGVHPSESGSM
jgi:hypothetical protein